MIDLRNLKIILVTLDWIFVLTLEYFIVKRFLFFFIKEHSFKPEIYIFKKKLALNI